MRSIYPLGVFVNGDPTKLDDRDPGGYHGDATKRGGEASG